MRDAFYLPKNAKCILEMWSIDARAIFDNGYDPPCGRS